MTCRPSRGDLRVASLSAPAIALALLLGLAGCGGTDSAADALAPDAAGDAAAPDGLAPDTAPDAAGDTAVPDGLAPETAPDAAGDAAVPDADPDAGGLPPRSSDTYRVRPSVEQVHIWRAPPATAMEVVDAAGAVLATAPTDELGSLVFRLLPPGTGYAVRPVADPADYTGPFDVVSVAASLPPESFYAAQTLSPGFGYLTMRDGTTLSVFTTLPGPPENGPYPTVVNYSGYSPSQPGTSVGPPIDGFCGDYPILCNAPHDPSILIAGLMGYATVGVNIRGTGCSGGAYDYFEPLQALDGYDVIEIVARQPWVLHHKVAMVGLSFPGISQLFVAAARPPSLAAILPQSVIADTGSSTLLPGGIYNNGFALEWIRMVLDRAVPYGDGWVRDQVDAGDTQCEDNQWLHNQRLDAVSKALDNPFYTDEIAQPLDPTSFVDRVNVPVFLTGHWQDEQTGPHFPVLFPHFTGAPIVRLTATNGIHMDGFVPQILMEWKTFLDLYVARRLPTLDPRVASLGTLFMTQIYGAAINFPANRFAGYTDYATALADYEAEPPVRLIFETGADPHVAAGAPDGTFEAQFTDWPIPETVATRFYLQPDGGLSRDLPPAAGGSSAFEHDPEAGQRITLASGSVEGLHPDWDYRQPIAGKAASFVTEPFAADLVLAGHSSVDLYVQATADDADVEVQVTEVRPDGQESFVQNGWLRLSQRALRADATELRPVKTHREADAAPLPPGEWTLARVEVMPFAHLFRAGSRLRLVIDTPGDSCARWRFLTLEQDPPPVVSIAHQAAYPSSLVLSAIPGVAIPTAMPACPALRGQPCRAYVPFANTPGL